MSNGTDNSNGINHSNVNLKYYLTLIKIRSFIL